jgi:RHS repeat-associated protein
MHLGGVLAEVDNTTSNRSWAMLDGLRSVRARGDDTGATTDTADWDAWGEATTGPAGLFGWTGEQADPETGLTYLRARYYSPVFGRFLARDPVSPNSPGTQGYNPYAYARSNPATFTDPSGMLAISGLEGLGKSIANAFWYLAFILECGTVGECRYARMPASSSATMFSMMT